MRGGVVARKLRGDGAALPKSSTGTGALAGESPRDPAPGQARSLAAKGTWVDEALTLAHRFSTTTILRVSTDKDGFAAAAPGSTPRAGAHRRWLVHKPRVFDLADLARSPDRERIYRMRCVEALVDGDPVGRIFARKVARRGPADGLRQVRRVSDLHDPAGMPTSIPSARVAVRRGSADRRGDASAPRCSRPASTARKLPPRTARRCAW